MMPYLGSNAAPFAFLLNDYPGASYAWSVARKLRSAYAGSCIRVRRSSDNAEMDIGFVNNVLDTSSLLTFVGAGDGFINTVYDQADTRDAVQDVAGNQPSIVLGGVLNTVNGQPAALFDAGLTLSTDVTTVAANNIFAFNVVKRQSAGTTSVTYANPAGGSDFFTAHFLSNVYFFSLRNAYIVSDATDTHTDQMLLTSTYTGSSTLRQYRDGNLIASTQDVNANTNTFDKLVGRGYWQEFTLYNGSDQSANRTGIETNILNFY